MVSVLLQRSPAYETSAWGSELYDTLQEGTNTNQTVLPGFASSCPVHQCPQEALYCNSHSQLWPSRGAPGLVLSPPSMGCPTDRTCPDQKNKEKWGRRGHFPCRASCFPSTAPLAKRYHVLGRGCRHPTARDGSFERTGSITAAQEPEAS